MEKAGRWKVPVFASLALAFASFGDAFLYPYLPLNHSDVGVPVAWVGILLSINRFIRILANGLMVRVLIRYGLRTIIIVAVVLAIASTAGYAFASTILLWLVFRLLWGLAFSAMRIGSIGYALQQDNQGLSLGISKSLQEAGPMLALFISPFLLGNFGPRAVFSLLALLSLPALYFSWKLPSTSDMIPPVQRLKFLRLPSAFNSMTLLTAILIDGIIIVVLGVLFLEYRDDVTLVEATALAAFYLGFRRVCLVVLSPAGGWVSDKIGLDKVFQVSMMMITFGLVILISGWVATGSVIVFVFYSVNAAITPATVARDQMHALAAVAENATWRDVGAAMGTLAGGMLLGSEYTPIVLWIGAFMLTVLLWRHSHASFRFKMISGSK